MKVGVVGGLGVMASPMAKHWKQGPVQVLRVHDRKRSGEKRDRARVAWQEHGAQLVPTFKELVGTGDLDGVFICCGKNGDDLEIIAKIAELLSQNGEAKFICHMSTVSIDFVELAQQFCQKRNVQYVNYPLTGGSIGAEKATMLILASGDQSLYEKLLPALSVIGKPKYFGADVAAGAEVKFMGHLMVFNGLIGISSAVAIHTECFNRGKIGGAEQAAFFDFLNGGAGGTKQWDVILKFGIQDNLWDTPFLIKYAAVDAIYTARMCQEKKISYLASEHVLNTILAFSYVLNNRGEDLATHAIMREMISSQAKNFDQFLLKHAAARGDIENGIEKCILSFPENIRKTVALKLTLADFEKPCAIVHAGQNK